MLHLRRPAVLTAPWLRGPLLGLREPMAVLAVVAAAAVLGLVVAAGPLFASSVGTAALHAAAAGECPQDDQVSVVNPSLNPHQTVPTGPQTGAAVAAADPVVRAAFTREGLPAPVLTTYTTAAVRAEGGAADVGVFASPGALAHVQVLGRVAGPGVVLPDRFAAAAGLRPGDRLRLADGRAVPVAGVYRDLDTAGYRTVLPRYWCHWRDLVVRSVDSSPPPFLLADASTVAALGTDVQAEWTAPVDVDALTTAGARAVAAAGRRLLPAGPVRSGVLAGFGERTDLAFDLGWAQRLQGAVTVPVLAIAGAGAVLALGLVAGAVLYWAQRRRPELALLAARGVGPVALGAKAAAELALPAAAGCGLGWGAGVLLLPAVAPSALTEPGARGGALLAVVGAWLVAVAVVVVGGALIRAEVRPRAARALRVAPPAVVAGLGAGAWWLAAAADPSRWVLPGVRGIDPAVLLAPLVGLAGGVLAAALLGAALLGPGRAAARRAGVGVFTAVHRAAAARGALVAAVCGLAVPVGLAAYAAGFTASTSATVAAKAEVYTGAPVVLDLRAPLGGAPPVAAATPVSYALATVPGDGGTEVELLGVDPATFARYAYDDPTLTGAPLGGLLGRLAPAPAREPVPAVLVAGGSLAPSVVQVRSSALPVRVVARAAAFPGLRYPDRPALVVDRSTVTGLDPYGDWHEELWTDQRSAAGVLAQLGRLSVTADDVREPSTFADGATLLPVAWTARFLQLASGLVAVLSVAGLLLFLAAREQRQAAASVLLRRMGLTRRALLRSLLLELGALTGWAWVTGAAAGVLALLAVTRAVDLDPGFLPATLLRVPVGLLAGSALGLAGVGGLLALWVRRRADRLDPAAVLRG